MNRSAMQWLFEPPSIRDMAPGTKVIVYAILTFWTAFVLFPIYWVLITSFKSAIDVNSGPVYLPFVDFQPSLHAWKELFVFDFWDTLSAYVNSLIIALSATAASVAIGSMASYALARFEYRPRFGVVFMFVLVMIGAFVAVGRYGVDWRLSCAAGVAVFYFLARALGRHFKARLGNGDILFW
ncbi:MAG: carbohydrate ABC transporter permease, partial [Boseongicola sp. SB0670_bin_30]|nr:carbohydrate ABC transporter permease [Boseongicola sp. SB0670_bin_30]